MALLSERVEFLITANPAQAIAGFESVARASDAAGAQVTSKWKDGTALIGFGAKALAVAGVAALGLTKLAGAASNLAESQNFVEREFGSSAKAIDAWAKTAAKSAGLSERAALDAAGGFASMGKAAGVTGDDLASFSTTMAQLAADLASLRNTSVEEATTAITSALRGRFVAISKYGVVLNETILKEKAYADGIFDGTGRLTAQQRILTTYNELLAQTGSAQGDFARTSDNLANQQRILSASFENLMAGIGQGLLPMFKTIVGGANSAVEAFNGLDAGTKATIGNLLGIATVATGAVGALSLIAGTVQKMNARFHDSTGALNGFGKAALGVGAALSAIALSQAAFDIFNQIEDRAGKTSRALQELAVASKGSAQSMTEAFGELIKQKDETKTFSHLWEDFGETVKIVGTKSERSIEDVNHAFDDLFKQSPVEAQKLVDSIREQADALDHSSEQYEENIAAADRWQKKIDLAAASNEVLQAEVTDATAAMEAEVAASEAIATEFTAATESVNDLAVATEAAAAAGEAFVEGLAASPFDEFLGSAIDLRTEMDDFFELMKEGKPVLDETKVLTGKLSDEQKDSTSGLVKLAGEYQNYIKSNIDAGLSAEDMRFQIGLLASQFEKQSLAAGATKEETEDYLRVLGLTPAQVETAIKLSNEAEARKKVELYTKLLDDIPDTAKSEIVALIANGEYQAAAAKMEALARDRSTTLHVDVEVQRNVQSAIALAGFSSSQISGRSAGGGGNTNITVNVPPTLNPSRVLTAIGVGGRRNGRLRRG